MGCGTKALKSCLGLISLFFWACAITLIVIGSIILAEYGRINELAQSTEILVPSMIIIGVGVFLFVVGLLGCIGGMKGNKAVLTVFFILCLIVLVGEVVAVAFGYQYRELARQNMTSRFEQMVEDCAGNKTVENKQPECDEIYFIQSHFHCCGADTYKDWYKWSHKNHSIPKSCCRDENNCIPPSPGENSTIVDKMIYTDGCSDKAIDTIEEYFSWIFVGTIVVIILQVLGLVATCIMLCRSQETPYLRLDSQGYRV